MTIRNVSGAFDFVSKMKWDDADADDGYHENVDDSEYPARHEDENESSEEGCFSSSSESSSSSFCFDFHELLTKPKVS